MANMFCRDTLRTIDPRDSGIQVRSSAMEFGVCNAKINAESSLVKFFHTAHEAQL